MLTLAAAPAPAREPSFPFLALRTSQAASPIAPWKPREALDAAKAATIDSTTLVYQVIAYVTKEVLDEESDEYRSSPVGTYLSRETPAEYSRSASLSSLSRSGPLFDSPTSLSYRVRAGTTFGDMWSALQRRRVADDHSGLSLDPKFGMGKAGFVLRLRW